MKFNQDIFNDFALYHNVIGFSENPIELKSKRMSKWYANWRTITEDVYLTDILTDFVINFTNSKGLMPETFYGVPEGATKLGILTQYKWVKQSNWFGVGSHVLAMGRGKPKEHGAEKDRYFLGIPRRRTIILEDVTTTGDSLIKEIFHLRKDTSADIIAAIALTHRNEKRRNGTTMREALEKIGVPFHYLSSAADLLPLAYQKQKPGEEIARAIEEEFKRYGEVELKLL